MIRNIKKNIIINRNKIIPIFLLLILAVAARDKVADIVNRFWVEPFMSKMYDSALWYFIALAVVLAIYYIILLTNDRYKSKSRLWMLSALLCMYVLGVWYSSVSDNSSGWVYKSIGSCNNIFCYYFTWIFILSYLGEISLGVKIRNIKLTTDDKQKLYYDFPIEDNEADSYDRKHYAKSIVRKIEHNFHKEGSFVIGINGGWGMGKTSLLNLIKFEIEKENNIDIKFEFRPWLSSSADDITIDFLKQLSNELSLYIPHIDKTFHAYTELATDLNVDPFVKSGLKLFKWMTANSLTDNYVKISTILKKAKIKVLVYIDDLDRLEAEEIKEVFRLVRNTANFPYIQFIIPFDRDYIIKTLDIRNPILYIQKIFNVEIPLPAFNSDIIRKLLYERLTQKDKLKLSEDMKTLIGNFFNIGKFPVERIIVNIRDVIRFSNAFILVYDALRSTKTNEGSDVIDGIDVADFLKIELLRYKYPEVHETLMIDPLSILEIKGNSFVYNKEQLQSKEKNKVEFIDVGLHNKLFTNDNYSSPYRKHEYVNVKDVLEESLCDLFPQDNSKHDIGSIVRIRAFDQYFSYLFDESNIYKIEIIQLLMTDDGNKQLKTTEYYHNNKKSREVYQMVEYIVSSLKINQEIDINLPFSPKRVTTYLKNILDSADKKLVHEISKASSSLLYRSYYSNVDTYIEVLKIWDKIMKHDLFVSADIMIRFMFITNFKSLFIRSEITQSDKDKIEKFLLEAESMVQMSELLSFYVDPENKTIQALIISKNKIKDIQLHYFMRYAEKGKVDEYLFKLFKLCADIEVGSRNIIWNKTASEKFRELINIDPEEYLAHLVYIDDNYINQPQLLRAIFNKNDIEIESYLFATDKNNLKGIDDARIIWKLYKYNNYDSILLDESLRGKPHNVIIEKTGKQLEELLDIKDRLDRIKESKELSSSIDELEQMKKEIEGSKLNISLNGELQEEISRVINETQ